MIFRFVTYGTVTEIVRGIMQILKGIWWHGRRSYLHLFDSLLDDWQSVAAGKDWCRSRSCNQ